MHEFITNIFFFAASVVFKQDIETTKIQLRSIEQKIDDGSFKASDYSAEMLNLINFYISNRSNLALC